MTVLQELPWRFILPIVAALLIATMFFWGDQSLFAGAKEATQGLTRFLPDVSLGAKEIRRGEITVPGEIKPNVEKFYQAIMVMKGKGPCFQKYSTLGLPDLGEVTIGFQHTGQEYKMLVSERGVTEVSAYPLGDITLCLVAGKEVGEHFYNNFLAENKRDFQEPYYKIIDSRSSGDTLAITSDGGDASLIVGGSTYDLKDGGFLFTPGENKICFFPTNDGWADREKYLVWSCQGKDLLSKECFTEDSPDTLPHLYAAGGLKLCGES